MSLHIGCTEQMILPIYPDLRRGGVAQKTKWAGGAGVSAGLQNDKQVSDLCFRKVHVTSQSVERRAERADDVHDFYCGHIEFVCEGHRVISLDGLAEIAGRGQVMMHPAIENQKFFSAGDFDVVHARDVDTSFAHQEASGLNQKTRASESGVRLQPCEKFCQPALQSRKVQLRLVRKVWNSKSTAK